MTKTFKISLRYLRLHAAFTALTSTHSPYTLVDTNGVHTPHYGDYTIKIQHIALLRYGTKLQYILLPHLFVRKLSLYYFRNLFSYLDLYNS